MGSRNNDFVTVPGYNFSIYDLSLRSAGLMLPQPFASLQTSAVLAMARPLQVLKNKMNRCIVTANMIRQRAFVTVNY